MLFEPKALKTLSDEDLFKELDPESISKCLRWTSDITYQKEVALLK